MMERTFSLLELNTLVRMTIEQTLREEYWVEAELMECRESKGHCYMELVQKADRSNTPVARAQAKCWRSTWAMIGPYFERTTGQPLHAGLQVRMKVYPQFHEAYGFSWIVTDIDPTFTLGDMARRRQQIVSQLRAEGIFDLQKQLELPLFCLRIAVISSASAAGYGDFAAQLAESPYAFSTQLFAAVMQGEQVEESIIGALNNIYEATAADPAAFDCVVIIRGGGATADLSGFDTLALAENVAQFPLPIITGIGHDRDESVLDMVSHLRVKTPTAAAQHLINYADRLMQHIDGCQQQLVRQAQGRMQVEQLRLARLAERIPPLFSLFRSRQEGRLDQIRQRLTALVGRRLDQEHQQLTMLAMRASGACTQQLQREQHRLELLGQRTRALDPALLLRRGYSITMLNGHAVRAAADVPDGAVIETWLADGRLVSEVSSSVLLKKTKEKLK